MTTRLRSVTDDAVALTISSTRTEAHATHGARHRRARLHPRAPDADVPPDTRGGSRAGTPRTGTMRGSGDFRDDKPSMSDRLRARAEASAPVDEDDGAGRGPAERRRDGGAGRARGRGARAPGHARPPCRAHDPRALRRGRRRARRGLPPRGVPVGAEPDRGAGGPGDGGHPAAPRDRAGRPLRRAVERGRPQARVRARRARRDPRRRRGAPRLRRPPGRGLPLRSRGCAGSSWRSTAGRCSRRRTPGAGPRRGRRRGDVARLVGRPADGGVDGRPTVACIDLPSAPGPRARAAAAARPRAAPRPTSACPGSSTTSPCCAPGSCSCAGSRGRGRRRRSPARRPGQRPPPRPRRHDRAARRVRARVAPGDGAPARGRRRRPDASPRACAPACARTPTSWS